jgi:hypothetical protein
MRGLRVNCVWTCPGASCTIGLTVVGEFVGIKVGRKVERLSALAVSKVRAQGMYADGGGLYLHVTDTQSKSWIFRFMLNGRAREMGLGPLHTVSLSEARDKARDCRQLHLAGVDPIEARKEERAKGRLDAAKAITFKEATEAYLKAHVAGWRNAKHADQWRNCRSRRKAKRNDASPVEPWRASAAGFPGARAIGPGFRRAGSPAPSPNRARLQFALAVSVFIAQIGSSAFITKGNVNGLHRQSAKDGVGVGTRRHRTPGTRISDFDRDPHERDHWREMERDQPRRCDSDHPG